MKRYVFKECENDCYVKLWMDGLNITKENAENKTKWFYNDQEVSKIYCITDLESGSCVGVGGVRKKMIYMKDAQLKTAGLLADFVIDKENRTAGPALFLQRSVVSAFSGVDVFLAFPNKKSYPIFIRVGYKEVAVMRRFIFLLNIDGYFKKRVPQYSKISFLLCPFNWIVGILLKCRMLPHLGKYRAIESKEHDTRDKQFIDSAKHSSGGVVEKSLDYIVWRYQECPTHKYTNFKVYSKVDQSLICIFILYKSDGVVNVVDALILDDSAIPIGIDYLVSHYYSDKRIISISIATDVDSKLSRSLKLKKFQARGGLQPVLAYFRTEGDGFLKNGGHYWIAGDADNV